jgi:putative cell wall-binding protein
VGSLTDYAHGLRSLLTILLVLAVVTASAPAAAEVVAGPPDRLDPPAPGEGPYLEDPADPVGDVRSFAAQPSAGYSYRGVVHRAHEIGELSGANRFLTSVQASRAGWPKGAPAVVLAAGEVYADALSAATLAGVTGGPLLLTPTARLESGVAAEIRRLAPRKAYVIGRLSDDVERAVRGLGVSTERIRSSDRYATSFAVASRAVALGADPSTVLVASGATFPDALSAGALAAGRKLPILLVPATGGAADLRARVQTLGARRTWVIGGSAAVPAATVAGLPGLERLAGPERTATAAAVATRARALGLTGPVVLASAEAFPDGLSGGVLAGAARRGPVLLTARAELSAATATWLRTPGPARLDVIGGSAAIAPLTRCQVRSGDTGALRCIEQELHRQGYHVGAIDGRLDHQSVWAFYAFQKAAGLGVDGNFGPASYRALLRNPRLTPRRPELGPNHVEIDIARQLVLVVRDGAVRHVLHTSTGKPSTPTVRGNFTVYEVRNVRQANRMYRPSFFHRGYAFHGYPEIPLHPASAGCARLYDGDMDFLWPFVQVGTRIASY